MPGRHAFAVLSLAFVIASIGGCSNKPGASMPTSPSGAAGPTVTVVNVTDGIAVTSGGTGTFNWAGQSVSIPAGVNYDNLVFNWYASQGEPAAFGTLYLLTHEYLGLPRNLGPSTPGFVARSERIAGGQYRFAADVKVDGGVQYWFYTDTQGSFTGSFDTDIYPGGDLYVTGYPLNPFRKAPASGRMIGPATYVPPPPGVFIDANFRLQGSATR